MRNVLLILVFILIILVLFIFFKKRFGKSNIDIQNEEKRDSFGAEGEKVVIEMLSKLPKNYNIFNDVMLHGLTGTVQIDHIVVSEYGIFVIETKNYKGEIFGSANDKKWKKIKNGNEMFFYNPLMQNKTHVSTLKLITQFKDDSFYIPIVAFSDDSDLKNLDVSLIRLRSKTPIAVNFNYLIAKITVHKEKILSEKQVQDICSIIKNLRLDSKKYAKKHIKTIEKSLSKGKRYSEYGNCPKCNGLLLLRNGKKGFFYGCENYPKCKFTKSCE